MRERQLTRHDIGREEFVSEVNFGFHMLVPLLTLLIIDYSLLKFLHIHNHW